LTIRTSHSARGAQRTARPTFFCDWRLKSVPLCSAHGFARPQKVTSHDSAVDGRGKLVLYHHQLRAAGQELTLPRRNWRCPARRHEIQPRAICLALPLVRAYAGSSARDYCVLARTGMQTTVRNWKKFVAGKHGEEWQRDFFDHRLCNRRELKEKTKAISQTLLATGSPQDESVRCADLWPGPPQRSFSHQGDGPQGRGYGNATAATVLFNSLQLRPLMNPVRKGLCERAEDWVWVYRSNDRPPPLLD
jgi:hypothetical protein